MTATTAERTVAHRLAGLDRWQESVETSTATYATEAWKARAVETISAQRRVLETIAGEEGPDTPLPSVNDVAYGNASHIFDEDEQWAILWQYRKGLSLGSFKPALMEAATVADDENLDKLALGFPALVRGIRRWRNEADFSARIKALLIEAD